MQPQPPTPPKYPPGTISRYNTTHGVWMVYAPKKVLSGVGDIPATVPAVPDGFEKVAEEAGAQNSPPRDTSPQGQERDRSWYDNKLVLGGAALAAVGAVVYATKRRKRSGGLHGLDGLTTKRRPDFQSQGGYVVTDDTGKKIVEIYRDMSFGTGSGWWYIDPSSRRDQSWLDKHHDSSFVGFNKAEALERVEKLVKEGRL
jgi:hypothetical protein